MSKFKDGLRGLGHNLGMLKPGMNKSPDKPASASPKSPSAFSSKFSGVTEMLKKSPNPARDPFNLKIAFAVTLVLSAFLFWLPVLGQMVAGYIGGRKSGSTIGGFAVAAGAIMLFVIVAGVLTLAGVNFVEMQTSVTESVFGSVPGLSEFLVSTFAYTQSMFEAFGPNGSGLVLIAFIIVVFGIIGGMMSGQVRSELMYGKPMDSRSNNRPNDSPKTAKKPTSFGSFEEYQPVRASVETVEKEKVPIVTAPVTEKTVPRTATVARAAEPVEEKSPFSAVLDMSDNTVAPQREILSKPAAVASASTSNDDYDYI